MGPTGTPSQSSPINGRNEGSGAQASTSANFNQETNAQVQNNTLKRTREGESKSSGSSGDYITLRLFAGVKEEADQALQSVGGFSPSGDNAFQPSNQPSENDDLPSSDPPAPARPGKRARIESPMEPTSPNPFTPYSSSSNPMSPPSRSQRSAKSKAVKGITNTYLATANWTKRSKVKAYHSRSAVVAEESSSEDSAGGEPSESSAIDNLSGSPQGDIITTSMLEKRQIKKWHGFYERSDDGDIIAALKRRCDVMIAAGEQPRLYLVSRKVSFMCKQC